jgi:hypothetical protein
VDEVLRLILLGVYVAVFAFVVETSQKDDVEQVQVMGQQRSGETERNCGAAFDDWCRKTVIVLASLWKLAIESGESSQGIEEFTNRQSLRHLSLLSHVVRGNLIGRTV